MQNTTTSSNPHLSSKAEQVVFVFVSVSVVVVVAVVHHDPSDGESSFSSFSSVMLVPVVVLVVVVTWSSLRCRGCRFGNKNVVVVVLLVVVAGGPGEEEGKRRITPCASYVFSTTGVVDEQGLLEAWRIGHFRRWLKVVMVPIVDILNQILYSKVIVKCDEGRKVYRGSTITASLLHQRSLVVIVQTTTWKKVGLPPRRRFSV